jgi:TRAP-type uncharacterized transport system fused permease subunit
MCILLTSAALEGWLLGPVAWPERVLLLLAAGGLVATSSRIVLAAGLLAALLVAWQVSRYGWRGAPTKTSDGTET